MWGLAMWLLGCLDSGVLTGSQLDSSVDGKNLSYDRNQPFVLELDVHADGGYQWDCQVSDTSVINLDSTAYRQKLANPNLVGGLTVETFFFRTVQEGSCRVTLNERRVWETGIAPIHTVRFNVSVHR
jgi:predicted secreted protein